MVDSVARFGNWTPKLLLAEGCALWKERLACMKFAKPVCLVLFPDCRIWQTILAKQRVLRGWSPWTRLCTRLQVWVVGIADCSLGVEGFRACFIQRGISSEAFG